MTLWGPWRRRRRGWRGLLPAAKLGVRLEEERLRAERSTLPLSIVVCDVARVELLLGGPGSFDRFMGGFNRLLQNRLRRVDVKGWYGARRLAVLMPATPATGAQAVIERLSNWVEAHLASENVAVDAKGLFEMATYPDSVRGQAAAEGPVGAVATVPYFVGGPSACGLGRALKRTCDRAASLLLLIITAPVMAAAAVAARLGSPGPAVFEQIRLGEGGRPFRYYKFRSMYVANDDAQHRDYTRRLISGEVDAINNGTGGGLVLKLARDPRVTPVGRFLRKTSIDELPQLFNVLKGDMSLVGPRPPIPYEVAHYRDWHLRRILAAKPGITGPWQVRSRSSSSFDDMVRLDLRYADNWSLWSDLKILARTIPAVLSTRGAC